MLQNNDFFSALKIDHDTNEAIYVQLYHKISDAIRQGLLAPGYRLPSVRRLAAVLSINPGTVVAAYRELEANGCILSRHGSGSTVANQPQASFSNADAIPELISFSGNEHPLNGEGIINMQAIALNPDIVSIEKFKELSLTVLDRDKAHAFSTDDSRGYMSLRQSISAKLQQSHFKIEADNIQLISGAQQGIDLVARALISYGDYVFTETPTYPGAIAAFKAVGARLIGIPLAEDGIDIDILEARLKEFHPRLLYLMPSLQNPTGISYSNEKRARLMGLAHLYNTYILEDDYLGDLNYCPVNFRHLKALDSDDRVIYLKSLSQLFMPGLHIGFLASPAALNRRIAKVKQLADLSSSGLTQRVLDLYLRKNIWDTHLKNLRSVYASRFEFTRELLKKHLPPSVSWQSPIGGLSFWLKMPPGISSRDIIYAAENKGLLLTDGNAFFPETHSENYLRISFATLAPSEIKKGVDILTDIINTQLRQS